MPLRRHLQLLAAATAVWVAFWLAGLPDYYRQYSTRAMIVFEVLLLGPVWLAGFLSLRPAGRTSRMRRAVGLSFYFTVPLFFYDLAYCGAHLGRGVRFLWEYWYLTTYYVVPWALFLPTAAWLGERPSGGASHVR